MFQWICKLFEKPASEQIFYGMRVIINDGVFRGKEATIVDQWASDGAYLLRIEVEPGKVDFAYMEKNHFRVKPM